MRLSFEVLERRELMDGCGIVGPMPLAEVAPIASCYAEPVAPVAAIDLATLYGPLPTTASRAVYSADLVRVEAYSNVPSAPYDLTFGSYDPTTRKLETSWSSDGANRGFTIQYSTDGATWTVAGYAFDSPSRVASDVGTDATYYCRVAAINEYGQSDWVVGSWNYGESLKPSKPGEISFESYDPATRKLSYSWGFCGDDSVKYYPCEYSYDGAVWRSAGNVKANRNYRTASGVSEGSTVYFRVCSQDGDGVRSDWVYATWDGALN